MADYYPLLAKAVAALPESTADTRRAIYERARKALIGQLRKIEPPIAEADIARENGALDESIARLEGEIAAKVARELSAAPVEKPAESPAPAVLETPAKAEPPAAEARKPEPPSGPTPRFPTPPASPVRAAVALGPVTPAATQSAEAPDRTSEASEPKAPETGAAETKQDAAKPKPFSFRPPPPRPPEDRPAPSLDTTDESPALEFRAPRPREAPRPPAPTPISDKGGSKRLWIVGGVVVGVVLLVAGLAITLKPSSDLSHLRPQATTSETPPQGKIAERVDRPANSGQQPAGGSAPRQPTTGQPPLPVAHRAALLIEAPDTQEKVKTYIGSVIWRLDSVPGGPGRPLGTSVHGDVDIPEAKVRMSLDIQKNMDETLPASHTIEVRFIPLQGSDFPGVKQVGSVQMRREDASNGDSLAGIPVQITDNFFLIGLARGDLETRNIDLLKNRGWLDLPIALNNGRIAKFSLEKGVSGDRVIADAITAWDQQK
jgi:hypothetical protein